MTTTPTRNPNLDITTLLSKRSVAEDDHADPLVGPRPGWWWTGPRPPPPGSALRPVPMPNLATCTREQVVRYFDDGWLTTEVLFSALQGERAFLTPAYHQLRHPMIFYMGHPAAFYINKLRLAGLLHAPIDPALEQVFETGVDEMSWDDMSKNAMSWPSVREVVEYRRRVYSIVRQTLATIPALDPGHDPITMQDPAWALLMAFEHERIHIETSSVLLRELPLSLLRRPDVWPPAPPSAPTNGQAAHDELLAVPRGDVLVGKPPQEPSFGWDNEYGERRACVRSFRASRYLVSNREFYEFVVAGGYQESKYWPEPGWRWRQRRNAKWPTFWVADGPAGLHRYRLRTIFEVVDMAWSWPVVVNWHEAKAYCAWKTEHAGRGAPYRLITEAEHHRLREHDEQANLDLRWGSEAPVDALPPNGAGFCGVFGNVWQWCEDDFHPLDGFRVHPLYEDFSAPCFDGEHKMIMGGSFISTGDEATRWARFHFRPHFFQHAGFRLARSDEDNTTDDAVRLPTARGTDAYEGEKILGENLMLHYGSVDETMPYDFGPRDAVGFPQRIAALTLEAANAQGLDLARALDVGCAVGGSTFALARGFRSVLGVDLSVTFMEAAQTLRRDGRLTYRRRDEGEIKGYTEARVPPDIDRRRVTFRRANACALPLELAGFDAVLAANLICRLAEPRAFVGRLFGARALVRPGGLLVLATPFTWDLRFTSRDAWLGGRDGEPSLAALRAELGGAFELLDTRDMPFLIREHARKFQYVVTLVSVWRRRDEAHGQQI
ncbi:MAG: 5-histidylcysteine sulfoxide synthase [Myxococcota bacterium]